MIDRTTTIGASEAAAACGLDPWKTVLQLYLEKRGEWPAVVEDNAAMRRGRRFEPLILEDAAEVLGVAVAQYPVPRLIHPSLEFVSATPDAILADGSLVECKSSAALRSSDLGEEGTDEAPTSYVLQAQQQLAVTGRDLCHLAVVTPSPRSFYTLRMFRVERNPKLIDAILEKETLLWERIQAGMPPEPDWQHRTTLDVVRALYGPPAGEDDIVDLDQALVDEWLSFERLGKEISSLAKQRDEHKARVLHAIGAAFAGDLGDGRIVRRKEITRAGYTVEPSTYIDVRATKISSAKGK